MKKIIFILLATSILMSCKKNGTQDGKYNLELRLEKGEKFAMQMNVASKVKQTVNGRPNLMELGVTGEISFVVTDVIDDNYKMDVRYSSLGMTVKMRENSLVFSSTNPVEGDMVSKLLNLMTVSTFQMTMTKKGKVIDIQNTEKIIDKALEGLTEIGEPQKEQLKFQLEESFGENGLRGTLENSMAVYPEGPVSIGEKWTIDTKLKGSMNMDIHSTYSLDTVENGECSLSMSSTISTKEGGIEIATRGIKTSVIMQGSMKGKLKISETSGWIKSGLLTQKMDGTTTVEPNDQRPEGMTIPMDLFSTITLSSK